MHNGAPPQQYAVNYHAPPHTDGNYYQQEYVGVCPPTVSHCAPPVAGCAPSVVPYSSAVPTFTPTYQQPPSGYAAHVPQGYAPPPAQGIPPGYGAPPPAASPGRSQQRRGASPVRGRTPTRTQLKADHRREQDVLKQRQRDELAAFGNKPSLIDRVGDLFTGSRRPTSPVRRPANTNAPPANRQAGSGSGGAARGNSRPRAPPPPAGAGAPYHGSYDQSAYCPAPGGAIGYGQHEVAIIHSAQPTYQLEHVAAPPMYGGAPGTGQISFDSCGVPGGVPAAYGGGHQAQYMEQHVYDPHAQQVQYVDHHAAPHHQEQYYADHQQYAAPAPAGYHQHAEGGYDPNGHVYAQPPMQFQTSVVM